VRALNDRFVVVVDLLVAAEHVAARECNDRRVRFRRLWYWKPTPKIFEVPGVGPKPVKDWTDEDVEAVARPFQERAERFGNPARLDFVRLVLQIREEEREWLKKTSRSTFISQRCENG
jgi:hypothetical protein